MTNIKTRSFALLAISLSFAVPALSHPMDAGAETAPTQTFSGGGTGYHDVAAMWPFWSGSYSATSQLGSGTFQIGRIGEVTGTFIRADGQHLTGRFDYALCPGADECLEANLEGTGDIASAHVELAMVYLGPTVPTLMSFIVRGTLTLRRRTGYAMVGANGTTYTFGGIDHLGGAHTAHAVDIERTSSGMGYWIVNAMGEVYAFGDASFLGNASPSGFSPGETVTSFSATPSGKGYWLFTSRGRALPFGDARFFGDLHALALNGGVVGSVATPTGGGYYMVGSDGGVFAFGDARFRGSMGNARLNQPVVGLVPTPDNAGYWLVASDGGVFSFDAHFYGSMGGTRLNQPIGSMVPYGNAYLMIASDGGVFNFSNAPFFGSEGGRALPAPIVNGAAVG